MHVLKSYWSTVRASVLPTRWKPLLFVTAWLATLVVGIAVSNGTADLYLPPKFAGGATIGVHPRRRGPRRLPTEASASYSRFSSDLQDESTIVSQQSNCRDAATRNGQPISPTLEFSDAAISGTKLDRSGLNALLAAAEQGAFNTLYFYSLSRLARESIIGMPILKRLANVLKIRVISITEGLDTSREGWEIQAQILLMQHERYIKELSANTFRGQELNVKNGYSNGDYCLGYTGAAVPGTEHGARNRRVRMGYVIDPVTSRWPVQIFQWFVHERRTLSWILRELNRLQVPKDHRATTPVWRHPYLLGLLSNRKYVGDWSWGEMKNMRDPATGGVYQEERPGEVTEKYRRQLPNLRLIDDETFAAAQQLLAANRERFAHGRNEEGEFAAGREGAGPPPSHLLSGLIACGACGHRFYVGGTNGKYLYCPGHARGTCICRTTLNRALAEELILTEVGKRILADEAWLAEVLAQTHAAWVRSRRTLPDEVCDLEGALVEVRRKIGRLVDLLEGEQRPDPEIATRLAERRAERRNLEDRLTAAQAAAGRQPIEPTPQWIREKLRTLQEVLHSGTPAAAIALQDLLGGRIQVREARRDGSKRRFLTGTLRLRNGRTEHWLGTTGSATSAADDSEEDVTIEFRQPNSLEADSARAWDLRGTGIAHHDIARQLGRSKAYVTKVLKLAAAARGIPYEDGRSGRLRTAQAGRQPALFETLVPEVGRLAEQGMLLIAIAARLQVDKATVTFAYKQFRVAQGLPPLDGRARRKLLEQKNRPQDDAA